MIWSVQLICVATNVICESMDSSISQYVSVNGQTKKKPFGVNSDSQRIFSLVFLCCFSESSINIRSSAGNRNCTISGGSALSVADPDSAYIYSLSPSKQAVLTRNSCMVFSV